MMNVLICHDCIVICEWSNVLMSGLPWLMALNIPEWLCAEWPSVVRCSDHGEREGAEHRGLWKLWKLIQIKNYRQIWLIWFQAKKPLYNENKRRVSTSQSGHIIWFAADFSHRLAVNLLSDVIDASERFTTEGFCLPGVFIIKISFFAFAVIQMQNFAF